MVKMLSTGASKPLWGKLLAARRMYHKGNIMSPPGGLEFDVLAICPGLCSFQLLRREPFVTFRTFSAPPNAVLHAMSSSTLVDNLVNKEFLIPVDCDGIWWHKHSLQEKFHVVLHERLYLRSVEHREDVWLLQQVKRYC